MLRVLVVDDDEIPRYLVRQLLPRGAFEVREVDGVDAALAEPGREPIDVVLVDLNMTPRSGIKLLEELAAPKWATSPPVIVLTSLATSEIPELRQPNLCQIISKSEMTFDLLVAAIRQAIQRSGPGSPMNLRQAGPAP